MPITSNDIITSPAEDLHWSKIEILVCITQVGIDVTRESDSHLDQSWLKLLRTQNQS